MAAGYELDPRKMPFLEHLVELRTVLVHSFIAIGVATAGAWFFSGRLLDLLIVQVGLDDVQFLGPMEPFNARFKVALIVGLCVGLPVVTLRIWAFLVPAFRMQERRVIVPSTIATAVLFLLGVAFSVLVLTPLMLGFLLGFSTERAEAHIALGPLLSFVFRMAIACAILFQMPLVLGLTTLMGVTSPRFLWGKWRHAVVGIFILSAVVTPGDGPSQVILSVPLVILYFLSVLISWFIWRARRGSDAAPEETPEDGSTGSDGDDGDDGDGGGDDPPRGGVGLGADQASPGAEQIQETVKRGGFDPRTPPVGTAPRKPSTSIEDPVGSGAEESPEGGEDDGSESGGPVSRD